MTRPGSDAWQNRPPFKVEVEEYTVRGVRLTCAICGHKMFYPGVFHWNCPRGFRNCPICGKRYPVPEYDFPDVLV